MKVKVAELVLIGISVIVLGINHISLFQNDNERNALIKSQIAKGIVLLESDERIDEEINLTSFPIEYYFCVNNFKENMVNEVDFDYVIEIENLIKNFPVSYILWDCDNHKEIPLIDGKSESMKISKLVKESRKFKLYMEWRDIDGELADDTEIKIKVNAVQSKKE